MNASLRRGVRPSAIAACLTVVLVFVVGSGSGPSVPEGDAPPGAETQPSAVVVLPGPVLASMNERFRENNEHWDEAPRGNPIYRMNPLITTPGERAATQLEYLGCLQGKRTGDTVRIQAWREARDLLQFQFGVNGDCDHVEDLVGTWHTHPYRADARGEPVKVRDLSENDLRTFGKGDHDVILVLWDVDSVAVALRADDGRVIRSAPLVVR